MLLLPLGDDHDHLYCRPSTLPICTVDPRLYLSQLLTLVPNHLCCTPSTLDLDCDCGRTQPRVRDHRSTWKLNATHDGIAANYYPVTAAMEIEEKDRAVLSVVVDRAQGAARSMTLNP